MTQVNNIVNIVKPVKLGMLVNRVKLVSLVVIAKIPGAFCGIGERKKSNICFNFSSFDHQWQHQYSRLDPINSGAPKWRLSFEYSRNMKVTKYSDGRAPRGGGRIIEEFTISNELK